MDQLQDVVHDLSRVREYLAQERTTMATIVQVAAAHGAADTLDELFSEGSDWATYEPPPDFDPEDDDGWYPLYRAARLSKDSDKRQHAHTITTLLRHGADLYRVHGQVLRPPREGTRSRYPGEDVPPKHQFSDGEDEEENDDGDEDIPWYGFRSVIHAILEDGLWVKPIFDFAGLFLDPEHRDPQGRTFLLSACRSALGADASIDNTVADVGWNFNDPFYYGPDVFPASTPPPQTVLRTLLDRGANPLATDNRGKNALHNLLEAHDPTRYRAAVIQRSLQDLVTNFPALLNQPDKNGDYPLHTVLRRMREYHYMDAWVEQTGLESCVTILLEAKGIDAHVRDGRGNTVLHYLADCSDQYGNGQLDIAVIDPTSITPAHDERHSAAIRKLLDAFLAHGVDVRPRNHAGRTAVQVLFDNGSKWHAKRERTYGRSIYRRESVDVINATDVEVLGKLDAAGADWNERDAQGRTLLHALAMYKTDRTAWRCRLLLEKGVDPSVRDKEGRTAAEVAVAFANTEEVVELLQAQ